MTNAKGVENRGAKHANSSGFRDINILANVSFSLADTTHWYFCWQKIFFFGNFFPVLYTVYIPLSCTLYLFVCCSSAFSCPKGKGAVFFSSDKNLEERIDMKKSFVFCEYEIYRFCCKFSFLLWLQCVFVSIFCDLKRILGNKFSWRKHNA